MRTNQWHSPATVWGTLAILASLAAPVTAQDWARLRTGAEKTIFFRAAVPLQSFREITFLESLKKLGAFHINNYEASSTQKVGGGITKNLAPGLTAEEIAVVKNASRGRRMAVYSIPAIGGEEPAVRALFEFAKDISAETIVSTAAPEALPMIDKLAAEFHVKVALLHADRKLLAGLGENIGACAGPGDWLLPGDRLMVVRLSGLADWKELFLAIYHQKVKPAVYTFEPSTATDPGADLAARLDAYETALTPVMIEYVNELGRTTAIRTLDAQTRLTPEEKADARRKMDAAMPAQAQAKPGKPRKLLVFDLQVGYPGHPSIPYANYVLEHFGPKTGAWEATFNNDLANFQYDRLRHYDAVFLNNTVGLLFPDPDVRASILRFLKEGGGLAGYHASTHASIDWPEFTEIIGASSGDHREATEKVTVKLDDPTSPLNAAFRGREFLSVDEHFRWTNFSRQRVHVLLSIDVPKTDLNQGRDCSSCTRADNDYAISWVRRYGKGRVFYTSLGHAPTAFMEPNILGHILAGIQFALGDLDTDTTPGNQPAPQ